MSKSSLYIEFFFLFDCYLKILYILLHRKKAERLTFDIRDPIYGISLTILFVKV